MDIAPLEASRPDPERTTVNCLMQLAMFELMKSMTLTDLLNLIKENSIARKIFVDDYVTEFVQHLIECTPRDISAMYSDPVWKEFLNTHFHWEDACKTHFHGIPRGPTYGLWIIPDRRLYPHNVEKKFRYVFLGFANASWYKIKYNCSSDSVSCVEKIDINGQEGDFHTDLGILSPNSVQNELEIVFSNVIRYDDRKKVHSNDHFILEYTDFSASVYITLHIIFCGSFDDAINRLIDKFTESALVWRINESHVSTEDECRRKLTEDKFAKITYSSAVGTTHLHIIKLP